MGMKFLLRILGQDGTERDGKGSNGGIQYFMDHRVAWTAKGYGKQAMTTVAAASLVVRPSTVAMATLRNNSGSGKVLVIERVFGHNLVAVANSAFAPWICVHPVGMADVTNDITVRNSTNGGAAGGSTTKFDIDATVVDDGWFPWGDFDGHTVAVTTPGGVAIANIAGRIIIPETAAISLTFVATTTAVTLTCGFHWFEVPLSELAVN